MSEEERAAFLDHVRSCVRDDAPMSGRGEQEVGDDHAEQGSDGEDEAEDASGDDTQDAADVGEDESTDSSDTEDTSSSADESRGEDEAAN